MPRPKLNHTVLYPVFLDLRGASVLVVGGGNVAARKISTLLEAGAKITLVALNVEASIEAKHGVRLIRRRYRSSDIKKQRLVFALTNDTALNRRIAADARRARILVNVAAPPESGDMQIPAQIRRGSLCVAVSTGGASAALASGWRQKLERIIGPEWEQWLAELERLRRRILSEIKSESARRKLLQKLGTLRWGRLVRSKGLPHARAEAKKLIRRNSLRTGRDARTTKG
jgi:precorrin-2 dehydrogenase/sirohydrochlorin ferrochelatase